MSTAEAILNQNTHSETLMVALPALHRVVAAHPNYKAGFLLLLRWWLTFKEDRRSEYKPTAKAVLQLLSKAQEMRQSKEEDFALEVIGANWEAFAPAEYLLGCT